MHIHCLGLNHNTAEISLRERLAFSDQSIKAGLARLGCGVDSQPDSVTEMAILSTCNRVEIYAVAPDPEFTSLETFLSEVQGVPVSEFAPHLYRYLDATAVDHLFRVAAGLDSLVLGEPQILGQVMNAFELARSQGSVGPVLTRLFQSALHTGKRARTETAISHNPASIASIAAHLAEKSVGQLEAAHIAILGAGEMAELSVEALRKRGASQIRVINRTLERARQLSIRWSAESATFEQLPSTLRWADILITSTGAPHTLVHADDVRLAIANRPGRPIVIIDIALPRDVDVEVGSLSGVQLYDIDQLHEHLEHSLARREQEVPFVEAILEEEIDGFLRYLETLDVVPLIAELNLLAENIRQAELEKTLRRLPELTEEERQRLEAMTQALVKKILHNPIAALRAGAGSPNAADYAAAARSLFGLESSFNRNGHKVALTRFALDK